MTRLLVRAPIRVDLAGGTLDLWPLYLFNEGARTINVAVSYHVECEISRIDDESIEVNLLDADYSQKYASIREMEKDRAVALLHAALSHFKVSGIRVSTRSDAPRGSGLGASSALAVSLVRAISEIVGDPIEGEELVETVRDLETRLLGVPAGVQDYYPAVFGGLSSLRLEPGKITRQPLPFNLGELSESMIVHYSGVSHFSGTNNWEIYKRFIDGEEKVRTGLRRIADTAARMESAFEEGDLPGVGRLLGEEWENRKALFEGVSTSELDEIVQRAAAAGAYGTKVCGAGGGGCLVILTPPEKREDVIAALKQAPGRHLEAAPVPYGLVTQYPDDSMSSRPQTGWKANRSTHSVEQFWHLESGELATRPFAVVRVKLTFDESRRGLVETLDRVFVAEIDPAAERVRWQDALKLESYPEGWISSPQTTPDSREVAGAIAAVASSRSELRETAAASETLSVWYNPELGVLSSAGESKEEFAARSLQLAREKHHERYDQITSTLRLSLDQVRERFERDRQHAEKERLETHPDQRERETTIPWGQLLLDITNGLSIDQVGETPYEKDSWDKIRLHQKNWEREKARIDDDVSLLAKSIEPVTLTVKNHDVKIEDMAILWARSIAAIDG